MDRPHSRQDWMSDHQWSCACLFRDMYKGFHHCKKIKPYGQGIEMSVFSGLATYDFNELTRLVFMCHDRCIRAKIVNSGPGRIKIILWQRGARTGSMFERHPTLEQAVSDYRAVYPVETETPKGLEKQDD